MESFSVGKSTEPDKGLSAADQSASAFVSDGSGKKNARQTGERGPELRQRNRNTGPAAHDPGLNPDHGEAVQQKPVSYRTTADLRGRPAHDNCHIDGRPSLLSHRNRTINLRGFFNLLVILVFVHNFRLVLENFLKYGVRIQLRPPTSIKDLVENWPILLSLMLMHISFILAFFIEKFMNSALLRASRPSVFLKLGSFFLTWGNALSVVIVPYLTIRLYEKAEPISASLLLAFSITWFLKLASFHHVLWDVRGSLARKEPFSDTVIGGEKAMQYPKSLTFTHYYTFLVMPTMCFQFAYPRASHVRWIPALRHLCEMTGCLVLMKIVIEQYMTVIVQNTFFPLQRLREMTILKIFFHLSERILKLSIPNLYVWLLMFFALFHHWLNFLAEITRFADREFYLDWWNSSSFGEYWRKWNLPIHNFFNRHVNKPLLRKGVPRWVSNHIIFIISALAHEYMICVPLHLGWTGLVFSSFIAQVPLIYLTSKPFFQQYPTAGNTIFWVLFCFTGQPLAIIIYYYLWGVKHGAVAQVDVQELHKLMTTAAHVQASVIPGA